MGLTCKSIDKMRSITRKLENQLAVEAKLQKDKKEMKKIVKIIETNLSLDNVNNIMDHQNRIVEANSWEDYCKAFQEYIGDPVEFKSLTLMKGDTIQKNCSVTNLIYDEFHLSCDIMKYEIRTKKLAYLVIE